MSTTSLDELTIKSAYPYDATPSEINLEAPTSEDPNFIMCAISSADTDAYGEIVITPISPGDMQCLIATAFQMLIKPQTSKGELS